MVTGCSDPGSKDWFNAWSIQCLTALFYAKDWFNAWSIQCLTALFYVVGVGLLTKVTSGNVDPGSKDWFNAWSIQCLTALFYVVGVGLLTKVTSGNVGEYTLGTLITLAQTLTLMHSALS